MQTSFRLLVFFLFFVSGACGLVYEITWMRMFRLVMGNTVFTSSMVLTVFMGGLALGSYLAGRYIDRYIRLLRAYGLLEGAIGIYGLAMPLIFVGVEPLYGWLYHSFDDTFFLLSLGRFLLSAVLLILPTTLMGATLPLLSRFITQQRESLGRDIGRLYAINTLGAAAGAALTGFFLIPALGVRNAIIAAAVSNLCISAVSLWLARLREISIPVAEQAEAPGKAASASGVRAVIWGMAGAGFASMVYEVAWTRTLTLLIGSSVYAFTLMLVAFITGLGTGSMGLSRWIDRRRNLLVFLGLLEIIVGLTALLVAPLFNKLPLYMVEIVTRYAASFEILHLAEFVTVFVLMLVPTFVMGGIFPLIAKIYTHDLRRVGRSVGETYAANTVGAVLGSFLAGFVLIPWIGVQHTILVAVGINLLIGIYFVATSAWGSRLQRGMVILGAVVALVGGIWRLPVWNVMLLNSAPYLYAYRYKESALREEADLSRVMTWKRRLLYAKEGVTATVTVVESGGELYLKVNGKTDASSKGDLRSQSLLAHLPLLLHDEPRQVLLVGLGSGISLGALERHPLQRIECVEISPEVVEGAHFFSAVNYRALEDPRLRLLIGDGRNHMALSSKRYDVIISQPSNLWIAGMADLFTREFFVACRERLARGGLACSWIQAYSMREQDFKAIVKTFGSVFPHVSLWESAPGGDYFLIGSEQPVPINHSRLEQRFQERKLQADFERIGVFDVANLVCSFVMQDGRLDAFAGGAPFNTDDNALLEFSAPKGLYQGLLGQPGVLDLETLKPYRREDLGFLDGEIDADLSQAWDARREVLEGLLHMNRGMLGAALAQMEKARGNNSRDMELQRVYPELVFKLADEWMRRGEKQKALQAYQQVLEVVPDDAMTYFRLGILYEDLQRDDLALTAYKKSMTLAPRFLSVYIRLARLYARFHSADRAVETYQKALALDPESQEILSELGRFYLGQRRWDDAAAVYRQVLALAPDEAQAYNNIGVAFFQKRDFTEAETWFRQAIEHRPNYVRAHNNLADVYAALGQKEKARQVLGKAFELEPTNLRTLRSLKVLRR